MKKNLLVFSLVILSLLTLIISPAVINASNNKPSESDFVGNLTCGGSAVQDGNVIRGIRFHENLPKFTNHLYDILKIATPVIIIITGMLDVLKAVSAQKEDEMKKAQKKFLNRLLAGVVVFLVFVIVETIVAFVLPSSGSSEETNFHNAMNCVKCFLNDYKACQKVGTVSTSSAGNNNSNKPQNNNNSNGGSTTHESSSGTTHGGDGGNF